MTPISTVIKSFDLALNAASSLYLDTLSSRSDYAKQARCAVRDSFFRSRAKIKPVSLRSFCSRLPVPAKEVVMPANLDNEGIGDAAYILALASICASVQPPQIVEFGTFLGLSAYVFAINSKNSRILTIDLPDDAGNMENLNEADQRHVNVSRRRVGTYYKGLPEADRIVELRADSRTTKLRDYVGSADLILIDGGHDRECISADTENAYSVCAPGSVILWDDYSWMYPEAVKYLDEISERKDLVRLEHTNLVVERLPE